MIDYEIAIGLLILFALVVIVLTAIEIGNDERVP